MALIGKDGKQPREVQDWDVDFGAWLPAGDAIDTVTAHVRLLSGPDTDTLVVDRVENTATVSKVWLSGGTDGAKYRVELRALTTMGRVKEVEFDIAVKEI
jgi:hypothetical protein